MMFERATWYWHWPDPGLSIGFKVRNDWHDPFDAGVTLWLMFGPGWVVLRFSREP